MNVRHLDTMTDRITFSNKQRQISLLNLKVLQWAYLIPISLYQKIADTKETPNFMTMNKREIMKQPRGIMYFSINPVGLEWVKITGKISTRNTMSQLGLSNHLMLRIDYWITE